MADEDMDSITKRPNNKVMCGRQNQRQRVIMAPIDASLINHCVMQTTKVTVAELISENIDNAINMNRRQIDIQILRIITPQSNQNATTHYQ
eukprot:15169013-Ditylum_brightwellii.AAC.1